MPIDERQRYPVADLIRATRFFLETGEITSAQKMLDGVKGERVQHKHMSPHPRYVSRQYSSPADLTDMSQMPMHDPAQPSIICLNVTTRQLPDRDAERRASRGD